MILFNLSHFDDWKSKGFKYVLVVPRDKYGVLRPLLSDKSVRKGYTLEMSEVKLLQVAENYFLTMDKDVKAQIHLSS